VAVADRHQEGEPGEEGGPMADEHWQDQPEAQDFPAAESYLSLLVGHVSARKLVKALRKQNVLEHFAAKDILRASGLPLLPVDDSAVKADFAKVQKGDKLSPVLLVRGEPLWVADGYHRICASYHLNEKILVPCRMTARTAVR
jgi:hypothetical protein